MKRRPGFLSVALLSIVIILTACNIPIVKQPLDSGISIEDQAKTIVALTMAAMPVNEVPQEQETPIAPSATNTEIPTNTPEPTLTPTNTLTPTLEIAQVSVSVDTNCRSGPAKIFDWVGALLVGEKAEVVGRSSEGDYWIIKNPDGSGTCWLWGYYATVTGPTAGLAVFTPPPTPTPLFAWDGTWSVWIGEIGGPYIPLVMAITTNKVNFSATMDFLSAITYSGLMDERHVSVAGTWSTVTSSGNFEFFSLGANQFQGNYNATSDAAKYYAICGSRGGAAQPNPCYSP
jgi:hypothetical protein